jgi:hypothetical protein
VRDRIVPPNRQNIYSILDSLGMDEYDEYGIIKSTNGVCGNDGLFLRELS